MQIHTREANDILNSTTVQLGWWIEVFTSRPLGIYYFGSFENRLEAEWAKLGCIVNLEIQGRKVLDANIKQCQPRELSLTDDQLKDSDFKFFPTPVILSCEC